MAVISFKKRQEPEILFGIKLPEVVRALCKEIKNTKKTKELLKKAFNLDKKRLVNLVYAHNRNDEEILLLVIYNNLVSEKEELKMDLEIEVFDFEIFEFDLNDEIDIEKIIAK